MISSISSIIIFNWGTEYSAFEGILKRWFCNTIKWWRVPEYGPSNPSFRNRLIKSLRLHGGHLLMSRLLVQIESANNRELVP